MVSCSLASITKGYGIKTMTDWQKAWRYCGKTRNSAKGKKTLKRYNHRKNRIVGKQLENVHVRLNGWDVS